MVAILIISSTLRHLLEARRESTEDRTCALPSIVSSTARHRGPQARQESTEDRTCALPSIASSTARRLAGGRTSVRLDLCSEDVRWPRFKVPLPNNKRVAVFFFAIYLPGSSRWSCLKPYFSFSLWRILFLSGLRSSSPTSSHALALAYTCYRQATVSPTL